MDVLFINPCAAELIYQELSNKFSAIEVPVWSLLLAQSCRSQGFSVAILDCDAERLTDEQAVERIKYIKPRLACFTVYGQNPNSGTTTMAGAITLCQLLKKTCPEIKTCFVGSHTSALPKEVLAFEGVDFILQNEGVYALRNLLKTDLEDIDEVKGIGYKDTGPVLTTPERIVPHNLMDHDLPGYAWDLLPYKEKPLDLYRSHFWHADFDHAKRTPFAAIYTSLGCSFKCQFCWKKGTKIVVANGKNKKIEDVDIGEVLTSFDVHNYKLSKTKVIKKASREVDKYLAITLSNGKKLELTGEHPLFCNGTWVKAEDLLPGDKVFVLDYSGNDWSTDVSIDNIKEVHEKTTVYNFECGPHDNYFADYVLGHNCMINILNRTNNSDGIVSSDSNIMRFWSPEFIIGEFDKLAKLGVSTIRISDEMLMLNKKYYEPLMNLLIERDYDFHMWGYSRVDTVREKHLEMLRKAGMKWVALGIESSNTKIRQEITKGTYQETDIREIVKSLRDADINVIANYIYGLPDDDYKSMQDTFDLSVELNTEMMNCYTCLALPGSPLYKRAKEEGWDLPQTFTSWAFLSHDCLPLPTKHLTAAQVLKFRDEAWDKYFTRPEYLNMVEKRFGITARNNIMDMTKIKLKRKLLEQ